MKILSLLMLGCVCSFGQGASSIGIRNPGVIQVMTPVLYPTQVVGLAEWLAADSRVYKDAGSTPAGDGDTVQQWNNIGGPTGTNVSQSTAARRPIYVTSLFPFPVLNFGAYDLANEHTLNGTLPVAWNHPMTLFAVAWHSNMVSSDNIWNWDGRGNYLLLNGGQFRAGSGASWMPLRNFDYTKWNVFTIIYTNTGSKAFYNSKFIMMATAGVSSQTAITVGSGGIGLNWRGYIAEIIVFTRKLSDLERYGIEMYLKRKYAFSDPF